MLVLTRKSDESVILGDNIEVKVLAVRGEQVSLGFTAPADMRIHRKEVYEAIMAANREAVGDKKDSLDALCGLIKGGKKE
ncbi:MAG: carbon storage regulator CsrA [Pontiellaceae bacterium]|nr:carbon storage regulator CsrA [Pontiellaceae bacterium]MBN2784174.1 carbon storage regulator CsrA [Pontiellaceae bacterium]